MILFSTDRPEGRIHCRSPEERLHSSSLRFITMDRNAVDDLNTNLEGAFVGLANHGSTGRARTFGALTAVSTGIPLSYFNRVFVFESPDRDDLERALSWMGDQSFLVTIAEPALESTERIEIASRLAPTDTSEPGMVLRSLDEIPRLDPTVEITAAAQPKDVETIAAITVANTDLAIDTARQIVPESMLTDQAFQPFLAWVDGQPVGRGLLFQHRDVAGVYNIGVIDEFRRRGIGEALTWAVLRAGRDNGAAVGVLQSSTMGYSLYKRMGFETAVEYYHFQFT